MDHLLVLHCLMQLCDRIGYFGGRRARRKTFWTRFESLLACWTHVTSLVLLGVASFTVSSKHRICFTTIISLEDLLHLYLAAPFSFLEVPPFSPEYDDFTHSNSPPLEVRVMSQPHSFLPHSNREKTSSKHFLLRALRFSFLKIDVNGGSFRCHFISLLYWLTGAKYVSRPLIRVFSHSLYDILSCYVLHCDMCYVFLYYSLIFQLDPCVDCLLCPFRFLLALFFELNIDLCSSICR